MPVLSNGTIVRFRRPTPGPQRFTVVRGPKGAPGADGSAAFEHIQATPSASWSITVPPEMGRTPNVAIYVEGRLVLADVEANSSTVNITFPAPVAGSAVLA